VAYLAQRTDKTTITRLLRCSWEAVAAITVRVVAEHLDDARLASAFHEVWRGMLLITQGALASRENAAV
jgi:hypothetical protein